MKIFKISKKDWDGSAHRVVFNEQPQDENLDYALLVGENESRIYGYSTIRNVGKEEVYMEFGGAMPEWRGSIYIVKGYFKILNYLKEHSKGIWTTIENTNKAMLKLALQAGFLITGVRVSNGKILLDHHLSFKEM